MKTISLTQGQVALVDDDDFEFLINYGSWHAHRTLNKFYVACQKTNLIYMHRLLLPVKQVDHKDGNSLNNQRNNLRVATGTQNQANRGPQVNNTSRFKGVYWNVRDQKWMASIRYKGYLSHLGCFDCKIKAAKAYDNAAICLFGEFARLNFPK